ncbi:LCP family protein [Enterococcus saccharolyticus]|uniref:Regulatory protein MsrR n=1 Tax=Candidatus Enterococcus willemsii TaxID=1857215 RepID=A0ABQ6YWM5_9ENTE|nr:MULTISPECIES: LCP family protein [Enterococcus]KAF1301522.1 transcriptional regulator [Enterococcus sp. CU12B]MCD5003175.1 LCP family protein [Enterococcus saccharolyticus]
MSRMDRYKHIHEESKQSLLARKTRKAHPTENWEDKYREEEPVEAPILGDYEPPKKSKKKIRFSRPFQSNEPENYYEEPPLKKPKKKRRKHRFLRCLVKLLILLLAYSGISFFAGQQVAKWDSSTKAETEEFNGFASADGSHNILLIGNDSRDGESARADTIMILQLDGPSKKPKLISFMRDTYVTIPGVGENKLNAAYAYGGAELVRTTLSQNFGIDTQYYTTVDFKTFEKVIDTLFSNGVKIDAEKDMSKNLEVPIKKGPQSMDGLTLLQYARFRMDEEGDFGRIRRQQQVMNAIFHQMKNPLTLLKLPYATGKVMGYASTDLSPGFLIKNTLSIAKGAGGVDRLSVPVDDSWYYGETYEAGSVLIADDQMNRQAIKDFLAK